MLVAHAVVDHLGTDDREFVVGHHEPVLGGDPGWGRQAAADPVRVARVDEVTLHRGLRRTLAEQRPPGQGPQRSQEGLVRQDAGTLVAHLVRAGLLIQRHRRGQDVARVEIGERDPGEALAKKPELAQRGVGLVIHGEEMGGVADSRTAEKVQGIRRVPPLLGDQEIVADDQAGVVLGIPASLPVEHEAGARVAGVHHLHRGVEPKGPTQRRAGIQKRLELRGGALEGAWRIERWIVHGRRVVVLPVPEVLLRVKEADGRHLLDLEPGALEARNARLAYDRGVSGGGALRRDGVAVRVDEGVLDVGRDGYPDRVIVTNSDPGIPDWNPSVNP